MTMTSVSVILSPNEDPMRLCRKSVYKMAQIDNMSTHDILMKALRNLATSNHPLIPHMFLQQKVSLSKPIKHKAVPPLLLPALNVECLSPSPELENNCSLSAIPTHYRVNPFLNLSMNMLGSMVASSHQISYVNRESC